jgi:hypothetical protein
MKAQTYLRLSLLLPYLLWGLALLLMQGYGGSENPSPIDRIIPLDFSWILSLYVIGAFFWFLPYTLLALGLLVWSIHRKIRTIMQVFAVSPLILTVLIMIEINLLSILTQDSSSSLSPSNFTNLLALNGLALGLTIAAGYLCVGIGFGLYKILMSTNVIKESETESQMVATEAI